MRHVDLCCWFQTRPIKSGCGTAADQTQAQPEKGLRDQLSLDFALGRPRLSPRTLNRSGSASWLPWASSFAWPRHGWSWRGASSISVFAWSYSHSCRSCKWLWRCCRRSRALLTPCGRTSRNLESEEWASGGPHLICTRTCGEETSFWRFGLAITFWFAFPRRSFN